LIVFANGIDPMKALAWLEFDYSEDAEGHGTFDAMASATDAQQPALQAEILRVLGWAHASFGPPQPVDEGGEWDLELQGSREVATPLHVRWSPGASRLELQPGDAGLPRVTLSLTLTGTPSFCAAFRQAFAV
jgi:hypothetical protein